MISTTEPTAELDAIAAWVTSRGVPGTSRAKRKRLSDREMQQIIAIQTNTSAHELAAAMRTLAESLKTGH